MKISLAEFSAFNVVLECVPKEWDVFCSELWGDQEFRNTLNAAAVPRGAFGTQGSHFGTHSQVGEKDSLVLSKGASQTP